jgi:nucleoside-diphosphate-sugar epimerase
MRKVTLRSEETLIDLLSTPSEDLVQEIGRVRGDIAVVGAGGKLGPSVALMARRALDASTCRDRHVLAISRWNDSGTERRLASRGVETVRFELTPDADVASLPDAAEVIYMVGSKFGSADRPQQTWVTNTVLLLIVAQRYSTARIIVFSTGNVYPLVDVTSGGCDEKHALGPVGEYAMSCLGRERVVEAASCDLGTETAILRLNYAVEPRYGVIADLASRVGDCQPVGLTTGHVNVVWQGYAVEVALRSLQLASSPSAVLNVAGPETASVRWICSQLGELLGQAPIFDGEEAHTALLSNASRCHGLFGYPSVSLETLIEWQVEWIRNGGVLWSKPTMFERRDGRF